MRRYLPALCFLLVACTVQESAGESAGPAAVPATGSAHTKASESFDAALREGASCAQLFELRNQRDPKDPMVDKMNESLRDIGCFSSSSTRQDG